MKTLSFLTVARLGQAFANFEANKNYSYLRTDAANELATAALAIQDEGGASVVLDVVGGMLLARVGTYDAIIRGLNETADEGQLVDARSARRKAADAFATHMSKTMPVAKEESGPRLPGIDAEAVT